MKSERVRYQQKKEYNQNQYWYGLKDRQPKYNM